MSDFERVPDPMAADRFGIHDVEVWRLGDVWIADVPMMFGQHRIQLWIGAMPWPDIASPVC